MVAKTVSKEKKSARKPCAVKKASIRTSSSAGYKKQYLKTKAVCKVTFMLPGIAAPGAGIVCIVGDFNNWSIISHPMKLQKSGDFTITIELETGRQYQYRYLIDESRWENDWWADAYVTTPYGDCENSVVIV